MAADPSVGRRARPRTGRRTVAVLLVGGLLLIGLLSALPMLPANAPAPAATQQAAAPIVVTVNPSAEPTAATTLSAGGGIGEAVSFSGADGAGTVTVTTATWTDTGEVAPVDGERYLVLNVSLTALRGVVSVDPILFSASSGDTTVLPGFGPDLDDPLGGQLLATGDRVSGQVGFVLPPGAVELSLLDENLRALARVQIPAP